MYLPLPSITRNPHPISACVLVSVAALAAGCGGGGGGTPTEPLVVSAATPTGASPPASLTVASAVPGTFGAIFKTSSGKPVPGVSVTCTADNEGTVASAGATTNADGVAQCQGWTLGSRSGTNTLTLRAGDVTARYTVTGTADVASALAIRSGALPVFRSGLALATDVVVQLTDRFGNSATGAGRAAVITVSGGTGVTALQNGGATTDPSGRAVFTALTLSGLAGARQLTITVAQIAAPLVLNATLVGGLPVRIALERDVPATAVVGAAITPPPIITLTDSAGNAAPAAGVRVTASIAGTSGLLMGEAALTDASGRATFTALAVLGPATTRTLQFFATGTSAVTAQPLTLSLPAEALRPAAVVTSTTAADTSERIIVIAGVGATAQVAADVRNNAGTVLGPSTVRWVSRDESRATVDANGRVTGVRAGRTFIVAHSLYDLAITDSVLVFVPATTTGPLVKSSLRSYRVTATDTFSITVSVEMRDGRALTAADIEVAWPGANSFPFAPFTVTSVTPLRPEVIVAFGDLQEIVRVNWTSGTPVSGTVALVRLNCRVSLRNVANQMLFTVNQLVAADLSDFTTAATALNPLVIIR